MCTLVSSYMTGRVYEAVLARKIMVGFQFDSYGMREEIL